jgi:type VI secretion system secreted protein VgrG
MSNAMDQVANSLSSLESALEEEHAHLVVEGVPYQVARLTGREKVSELFEFDVVCDAEALGPAPFELLGKSWILTLHDGFGLRRTLQGIIAAAERDIRDEGTAAITFTLRPNVFPLTLSRDSRVFQDKTVQQIVDEVMKRSSAPYRWELGRDYRERVYTAQYREDDWTFVSRLLEEEGIYYWFDHEAADTVIVFGDDSTAASPLVGGAMLEFYMETGMSGKKELVHELAAEAHATATKFTVGSFDPWNPALKVTASEGDGVHEVYDAPGGGPEDPSVCHHQAKNRFECAMSHRASFSGNSSSVRISPGRLMEITNHPLHSGNFFVTEVVYDVKQRKRFADGDEGGFVCHFECIDHGITFRAPEDTPVSKQAGFQSGRVVGPPGEEIHTDDRGCVRIQLHWDREGGWDDKAGKWMRVSQRGVSMSMLYPRIGWNVMTFMQEGNVDAPGVLARVHDAEHPPTYSLPDNKTRTVFKTMTSPAAGAGGGIGNEIRMEDLAGLQEMFMNASKDMNYTVRNNNGHNVGNNNAKRVGSNQTLKIGARLMKAVQNDQTCTVSGNEKLDVADNRDKQIGGNETREVTGDRKIECGSTITHTVQTDRTFKVTGNVEEESREGLLKQSCDNATVEIGGSATQKNEGNHNEDVGKGADKKVAESKTETAKTDYTLEVNDLMTETIGDNLKMKAGRHFMDGSDEVTLWDVKGKMEGKAKERVQIQAKDRIVLMCGGSKVEIDKENITITATTYEVSDSANTKAKAPKITQNPS